MSIVMQTEIIDKLEPTPMPSPTLTPGPTPSPTSIVEPMDRVEFEQDGNIILARLIFEKTTPPPQKDIWLFVSYKENGVLKRVEIPKITDMAAVFEIPEEFKDCNLTVYVWDKDMKPLMDKQEMEK